MLIHGGSGGVGHFAIQFAKAKGARVFTTVSTNNVQFARDLGADVVIDYKKQRFEDNASIVGAGYRCRPGQGHSVIEPEDRLGFLGCRLLARPGNN